nr:AraC family transcriptional regulator [Allorhizobium borbori]
MASPDELMKERVPGGRHQSFVTIACRPAWLEDFFGVRIQDHLTQPDEDYVHHPLNFTANLRGATQAILNRRAAARLDAAFITTKAQEIILATVDGVAQKRRVERQRLTSTDIAAIRSARMLLEESLHAPPDIRTLSRRIGINRTKLFYGFKRLYGTSTVQFIDGLRMNKARRLLLETDMSVSQVAAEVGYGFAANFSTRFKNHFGQSPRTLRREQP